MTRTICLHGPESVGKSALAEQLAETLHGKTVSEYGRDYCTLHGTDIGMAELVHIGQVQTEMIAAAQAGGTPYVITDTDALMTAVWADMMLGTRDPWFEAFSKPADLYLLVDIDLPFVDDGLRIYGGEEERRRFFDLCKQELRERGVPWGLVRGKGKARLANAMAAIHARFGVVM